MTNPRGAANTDPAQTTARIALREGVRGARYGEVLLVTGRPLRLEASVYNTLGLNDCPDDLWRALDAETIKRDHHARAAILNGPRHFLMDTVSLAEPGREIVEFGGLQMRKMATVRLPPGVLLGGLRNQPYTERGVLRTTVYVYERDRTVCELVAPDGAIYVMQSYSLAVDLALTEAALPALGGALRLPPGWRFRSRRLDEAWELRIDGEARVVQDDLENTYQRVSQQANDAGSRD